MSDMINKRIAKVNVVSSNLIARSKFLLEFGFKELFSWNKSMCLKPRSQA